MLSDVKQQKLPNRTPDIYTQMRRRINFFKTAIANPSVGAATMSSKYVVARVIDAVPENSEFIVEYGPGNGATTHALLKRLAANGKLLAVESNPAFAKTLRAINDKRLKVLECNAQDISPLVLGHSKADAIVASIPFSMLKPQDRIAIVRAAHATLKPGGHFIVFHQYSRLMLRLLKQYFKSTSAKFEPRNVFPCFILIAQK